MKLTFESFQTLVQVIEWRNFTIWNILYIYKPLDTFISQTFRRTSEIL